MNILHLCYDGNFINDSVSVFEKYYPQKNIFLVGKEKNKCRILNASSVFRYIPFLRENYSEIYHLCKHSNIDTIVLHGLHRTNVDLLAYLNAEKMYKVYWIFWGYELYIALAQEGRYELLDKKLHFYSAKSYIYPGKYNKFLRKILGKEIMCDVLRKAIPFIDYFCFWNYEDYLLFQREYNTNIQFKYFAYQAMNKEEQSENEIEHSSFEKEKKILINHQASLSANHISIMEKVASIDKLNEYSKIIPLSYGFSSIRNLVLKEGRKMFGEQFIPILSYMPKNEYIGLIGSVAVAIIGARRQEAAGNIIALLKNGVKVFLRDDNNLLAYYLKKGYIIFSLDKDLKTMDDLLPLSELGQKHNFQCYCSNRIYNDDFMPMLIEK
ncbi:hypothetical protein [Bacteroides cellulosilyticus]|uniref:hypothetical protein n=1 Tax=Bacteroides cellulosilyticus TaxID=246787 RepID=UPI0018AB0F7B|nr:hypothetical protein [Bacteroides cellulosilyticus]